MRGPLTLRQLEGMQDRALSSSDIHQIKLTVAHGFAPDEPTDDELNEWAAVQVMGWRHSVAYRNGPYWLSGEGLSGAIHVDEWKPTERVDQALQVAMETDHALVIEAGPAREPSGWVTKVRVLVDGNKLHYGPFESEVIARKIMLELHRRIEGDQ